MNTVLDIVEFIPYGMENAVSQQDLCEVTHLSKREVRQAVENARRKNAPICSSCTGNHTGYYLPTNKRECEVYLHMQKSRIHSARATMKPVKQAMKNLPD